MIQNHLLKVIEHSQTIENAYNSDSVVRVPCFLLSFILLMVIAIIYMREAIYPPSVKISEDITLYAYGWTIFTMGGVGFAAAMDDNWSSSLWICYAICNVLIAAYIATSSKKAQYIVFAIISTILMGALAYLINFVWFKGLLEQFIPVVQLNFVGILCAWSLAWFIYTLAYLVEGLLSGGSQCNRLIYGIFFLIGTAAMIIVLKIHVNGKARGVDMIGYYAAWGVLTLALGGSILKGY